MSGYPVNEPAGYEAQPPPAAASTSRKENIAPRSTPKASPKPTNSPKQNSTPKPQPTRAAESPAPVQKPPDQKKETKEPERQPGNQKTSNTKREPAPKTSPTTKKPERPQMTEPPPNPNEWTVPISRFTSYTNLGPLPTRIEFDGGCSTNLYSIEGKDALGAPYKYNTAGCLKSECCPGGHVYTQDWAWMTSYYSPAVCPKDYKTCEAYDELKTAAGETAVFCCPSNFNCPKTKNTANAGITARNVYFACESFLSSGALVTVLDNAERQLPITTRIEPEPEEPVAQIAYPIQVRFKKKELGGSGEDLRVVSTISSADFPEETKDASVANIAELPQETGTAAPPQSDGSLSPAGKAGLGVGVAAGALILIFLGLLLIAGFRRRVVNVLQTPWSESGSEKAPSRRAHTDSESSFTGTQYTGTQRARRSTYQPSEKFSFIDRYSEIHAGDHRLEEGTEIRINHRAENYTEDYAVSSYAPSEYTGAGNRYTQTSMNTQDMFVAGNTVDGMHNEMRPGMRAAPPNRKSARSWFSRRGRSSAATNDIFLAGNTVDGMGNAPRPGMRVAGPGPPPPIPRNSTFKALVDAKSLRNSAATNEIFIAYDAVDAMVSGADTKNRDAASTQQQHLAPPQTAHHSVYKQRQSQFTDADTILEIEEDHNHHPLPPHPYAPHKKQINPPAPLVLAAEQQFDMSEDLRSPPPQYIRSINSKPVELPANRTLGNRSFMEITPLGLGMDGLVAPIWSPNGESSRTPATPGPNFASDGRDRDQDELQRMMPRFQPPVPPPQEEESWMSNTSVAESWASTLFKWKK